MEMFMRLVCTSSLGEQSLLCTKPSPCLPRAGHVAFTCRLLYMHHVLIATPARLRVLMPPLRLLLCRAYPNVQNLFRELQITDRLQVRTFRGSLVSYNSSHVKG